MEGGGAVRLYLMVDSLVLSDTYMLLVLNITIPLAQSHNPISSPCMNQVGRKIEASIFGQNLWKSGKSAFDKYPSKIITKKDNHLKFWIFSEDS